MSASAELVQFAFDNDLIDCAKVDGRVRISVSRICENLGIDRRGQQAKLQTKEWATGELISLVAADGRRRDVYCLDLDALPMWLATIEPARVKEALRPKLVAYQKKAALVLRDHFIGSPAPVPLPVPAPRLSGGDDDGSRLMAAIEVLAHQQKQAMAVRATVEQHGHRLALVENTMRQNAAAIVPISAEHPELLPIRKQRLIIEHVNRYAAAMNMSQQDVWRRLYGHVDRRLNVRVHGYVLAKGETKLQRLFSLGLLDAVGKVCDTDLQIPVERQRALWATAGSHFHA